MGAGWHELIIDFSSFMNSLSVLEHSLSRR
jgi:hypothetical protein